MRLRNSFVVRAFLLLLTVCLILLSVGNVAIYQYSRKAVSEEVIRLNQVSLSQTAGSMGQTLMDLCEFGKRIAINTQMQSLLEERSETAAEQEARRVLMTMLSEFNDTHMDGVTLVEPHVIGSNGTNISVYNSDKFSWEEIQQDQACVALLAGETDMVLRPTSQYGNGQGVMGYSFQIVLLMRDLLYGQVRGVVILDVSELALHRIYRSYQAEEMELQILTKDGMVISNRDKKKIGTEVDLEHTVLQNTIGTKDWSEYVKGESFFFHEEIEGSDWILVEQMPIEMVLGTMTRVRNVALLVTLLCAVLAMLAFVWIARNVLQRVVRIKGKMEEVIDGDLSVRVVVGRDDEFGKIESAFNSMVEEIGNLIEKVRQSEHQKRTAEMDFLRAQINSHFIHNTLTSIRFMLEMDKVKEAGEMIFYFSKLLRQTLSRSNEFISLQEEIDTLQCYVMLQSYRYQGVFSASYDIEEDVLDVAVPSLILQPVVENAIFHGSSERFTHIQIRACRDQDHLLITIADDGVGMSEERREAVLRKEASMNRVGLRNIHDRIQINYGTEYGLGIESQEGVGTTITFILPIYREESLHEA